jgi:hypothetical protein
MVGGRPRNFGAAIFVPTMLVITLNFLANVREIIDLEWNRYIMFFT